MIIEGKRYKEIVGMRLKAYAEENSDKLTEFAEKLGIKINALHSIYFKGRSLPGAKLIYKLIKMGCDIAWLLDDTNENVELPRKIIYTEKQHKLIVHEKDNELYQLKEENKELKTKRKKISKLVSDQK